METFASLFLSSPEVIIILVLALILFGPQKLPEIGRQIGSAMRELRKMSGEVQRALDIDDYSHNGYDSGQWYDSGTSPAPMAPEPPRGAVVAQAAPMIGPPVAGVLDGEQTPGETGAVFVPPPGPRARLAPAAAVGSAETLEAPQESAAEH